MSEHCVKVLFPFEGADLGPVFALEDELTAAIEQVHAGEFDGNEVGDGEAVLYMYGPDADALYAAVAQGIRSRRGEGSASMGARCVCVFHGGIYFA